MPAKSEFSLALRTVGDAEVLTCGGTLDLQTSAMLDEQLRRLTAGGRGLLLVDLRDLDFMDSTGLGTLLTAHSRTVLTPTRFVVVQGPTQVRRLLELSGAAERLTIVDSPEQALDGR